MSWLGGGKFRDSLNTVELPLAAKRVGNSEHTACTPLDLPYTKITLVLILP